MLEFIVPFVATAAALIRTAALPRPRLYAWFMIYLGASAIRGIVLGIARSKNAENIYAYVWWYTEPLIALLWMAMAIELYLRIAALYPGLSRPGWAIAALVIAVGLTMASLVEPHLNQLGRLILFRRASATVLTVAIGALAMLFAVLRNNIPPNLVRHGAVMAVYFASQAIPAFAANWTHNLNWGQAAIRGAVLCYLAWAVVLTRAGETRPEFSRRFSDAELAEATNARRDKDLELIRSAGRFR